MTDVIDVEAAEEPVAEERAQSTAVIPTVPKLAVTPQVPAAELKERLDVIQEAQEKAMVPDVDYGVIPGTNKPTLLKPGAEKLSVLFQLDVQLANEKEWGPGDHLTVVSKATVYHAPTGSRLGYGEGVCTTRERKYAYRKKNRVCPTCGAEAIIKGKAEYGGGWICWKKKDGCGASFKDDDPQVVSQEAGEVENPDLPDLWNTVVKMAEKRARVDAVLAVTGASALFTQDMEDSATAAAEPAKPAPASESQLNFLDRLIGDKLNADEAQAVRALVPNLNGQQVSKAINGLKEGDVQVTAQLVEEARAWLAKQSDLPADMDGLEPTDGDEAPWDLPEASE
jgi:hypothetical protein